MLKYLITGGADSWFYSLAGSFREEHVVIVVDDLSMGKVENLDMTKILLLLRGMLQKSLMEEDYES